MLKQVQAAIQNRRLLVPGQLVLVAVSGGADSVALLYALHYFGKRLRISLAVAHLNHGIRGRAADADEEFVRHLAWRLGIPFYAEKQDVPALARTRGLSMEMAAREARYEFFLRASAEAGADVVATAHTADDQVETLLLRLARGTGPQGLGGMAYTSRRERLTLVRPLLDVTHAEVVAFLRRHKRHWREDATNRDTRIARNWVRHELIPLLERKLNPGIRRAILRTVELMREEGEWIAAQVGSDLAACTVSQRPPALDVKRLAALHVAARRRLVLHWLLAGGVDAAAVDFDAVERVLDLTVSRAGSKQSPISATRRVVRRYGHLILERERQGQGAFAQTLRVPGASRVVVRGLVVHVERTRGFVRPRRGRVGMLPAKVSVSAQKVGSSALVLRSWKPGDRIQPLGMAGSCKVQDILVDQKVPRDERAAVPVLVCRNEVIWVAGYRVARNWQVDGPDGRSLTVTVERVQP